MAVRLYMDHHVPSAITNGLRLRDIDVMTAYEDNAHKLEDPDLLDRALAYHRVLFTRDDDFLAEASHRLNEGITFYGIIYAHQLRVSIGKCVDDLELIAKLSEPDELVNHVQYLPL
ncbi:MAG: DUF5615 family PIN-like protein [Caldilineaceae bacterium]